MTVIRGRAHAGGLFGARWASAWTSIGHAIGFTPASWMSASILSFAVAAVITLLTGALTRLLRS